MSNQTNKRASLGQVWGLLLGSFVAVFMFIPRIINAADKAMNVIDDVLDSANDLSSTMKQTSGDFKNLSALEGQVAYQDRLADINEARAAKGLAPVDVASARNSDAVAEALAALGK